MKDEFFLLKYYLTSFDNLYNGKEENHADPQLVRLSFKYYLVF
jgi:hypothetical protein